MTERDPASSASTRAEAAWASLVSRCLVRTRDDRLAVRDGPRRSAPLAALWPFGQVLAASAAVVPLGVPNSASVVGPLLLALERYRSEHGYGPFPGDRTRYFDDNAWIALDFLQLASVTNDQSFVEAAAELFQFLAAGEGQDGGVYWVEGELSRNTCATAPTAQVALRLFDATGDAAYLDFAQRQMAFLDRELRDERGLYLDHLRADGSVEPTVWSYNQGTPIGAAVLLAKLTEDRSWLGQAIETALAADAFFQPDDGWWRQPPVFNAIFFRNLLALLAVAPDAQLLGVLDGYMDRVWSRARHRRTGLFVGGGIGSYDGRPTIDHAGLTQVFAFRAWPSENWSEIC
jgi:uncharacterized protein YyaL (SSP411 family)